LAPESAAPAISINIPCYRQLHYARRCVEGMLAQSFRDFELTLFDDAASDDYRTFVESLGDPRVRYHRNSDRLGAMRNMFGAIVAGRGRYVVAFHEDDLPAAGYLAASVEMLDANPRCGFVACSLREFVDEPPAADPDSAARAPVMCAGPAEFVRAILCGVEPMFGAVMYRRDAVVAREPPHAGFGTLVDRPFLLSILENWSCAIIRQPALAWYRHHDEADGRHLGMTSDHILRLFETYRRELGEPLSAQDKTLFLKYSGYWLMKLYRLAAPANRAPVRRFVADAIARGLFDVRYAAGYGRKRLARELILAQ
jgi:glycosyltransferase involved in cell wall biosynthesis